ncbi:hypothetical protein IFM89_021447 [Coptis chinensis]|uniref:Uncharacterized protein n=1 Tax=Coptis chinensis TaxID=261450 RepID=A0A835IZW1_9MAGN|nr:hypothetical protein IFM89_021447 [Coptis chinensis]
MERYRSRKSHHTGYDDALINLYRMSWILTPAASNDENVRVSKEGDPENWHVQGFPKVVKEAEKQIVVDCPRTVPDVTFFQQLEVHKSLERILYT